MSASLVSYQVAAGDGTPIPAQISMKLCVICGKKDRVLQCSRCKKVFYCSKEHQQLDWKSHKVSCKKLATLPDTQISEEPLTDNIENTGQALSTNTISTTQSLNTNINKRNKSKSKFKGTL